VIAVTMLHGDPWVQRVPDPVGDAHRCTAASADPGATAISADTNTISIPSRFIREHYRVIGREKNP
jgi:hypothetical protein